MIDLLVIVAVAGVCFGLVPLLGVFLARSAWRTFRRRFDDLRAFPLLTFRRAELARASSAAGAPPQFRLYGALDSTSGEDRLWVRGAEMTACVDLHSARLYLLPGVDEGNASGGLELEDASLEKIDAARLSRLGEGARVFVGGELQWRDGVPLFSGVPDRPLIAILHDGPDEELLTRTMVAGRPRGEYWNSLTPFALAAGFFSELLLAFLYSLRPAFGLSVNAALCAALLPLFPLLPPALPLLSLQKSVWRRGRAFGAWQDLVRLPLRHLAEGSSQGQLPDGQTYTLRVLDEKADADRLKGYVRRAPRGIQAEDGKWYCYGVMEGEEATVESPTATCPAFERDPGVIRAAFPGESGELARRFGRQARLFEIRSVLVYLAGIAVNATLAFILINSFR